MKVLVVVANLYILVVSAPFGGKYILFLDLHKVWIIKLGCFFFIFELMFCSITIVLDSLGLLVVVSIISALRFEFKSISNREVRHGLFLFVTSSEVGGQSLG